MKAIKTIKRYQNRKLYNIDDSTYVTFDEVAKMIKAGVDLRVIDNNTKNDITATTLTQLLYDRERKAKVQSSVELLKEIIRHRDTSFLGYIQARLGTEFTNFDKDQSIPSVVIQ